MAQRLTSVLARKGPGAASPWYTRVVQALLLVAGGGAIGTALRYGVALLLVREDVRAAFPWATFAVNVLGSFLLGLAAEALAERRIFGVDARSVVGTGMLGGFTTYSSFNLETLRMIEAGEHGKAGLYVGATLVACMVAGLLGVIAGRALRGEPVS